MDGSRNVGPPETGGYVDRRQQELVVAIAAFFGRHFGGRCS